MESDKGTYEVLVLDRKTEIEVYGKNDVVEIYQIYEWFSGEKYFRIERKNGSTTKWDMELFFYRVIK